MHEPTPIGSPHRLDDATFDAALDRAVARVVAARADDTAGARVVARLLSAPSWHRVAPRLMLAPAAALLVVAVVVLAQRAPSTYDELASTLHPESATATVAPQTAPVSPAGTADAGNSTRRTRPLLVAAPPGAFASSARRRSRARESAPPADDGTALPPIEASAVIDIDALHGAADRAPGPEPLPVDALELVALDAAETDPHQDR